VEQGTGQSTFFIWWIEAVMWLAMITYSLNKNDSYRIAKFCQKVVKLNEKFGINAILATFLVKCSILYRIIVITHPNWSVNKATHEQMAEMGKMGAYIGLFMYGDVPNFNNPNCDPMEMFEIIKKVGPEHIVLASDLGTVVNMPPWEGMKLFMRLMIANGVPKEDIRRMCSENPKYLLGIN
jgi:predicted metal-dependent TIM-barrel fold hydrolase